MTPWDQVDLAEFPGRDIVPQLPSLAATIDYWAERTPEALLDDDGARSRSYAQGARDIAECARALVATGVQAGDRVAVLTTPRPEYLTLLAALGRVGAVWVGLNPSYKDAEIEHVLQDSRPTLIASLDSYRGEPVSGLVTSVPGRISLESGWSDFLARGADLDTPTHEPAPEDAALIVYTSGSTGKPKGAVISQGAYLAGCYLQASRYYHPGAKGLAYLPVNHVAGLLDLTGVPIAMGAALHYLSDFDPGVALELIQTKRVTFWGGVPTVMQVTAAHPNWANTDFSSLRHLVWGGSPMPIGLVPTLRQTGAQLGTVYGLTECCVASAYADPDSTDEQLANAIGRPDPRLEYRIDSAGPGEPGELLLRNPSLMTEYLHQPEATAEAFTEDGFLHTGDIAQLRPDGLIELVGRSKEMFKSGGYNVYPREVEQALEEHPGVELAVVVDVPDEKYYQVGHAFVLPSQVGPQPTSTELIAHCRERLAGYKIPKAIDIVKDLPFIAIGKVDRVALRKQASTD
ncbi:MAG TPA: AMP-binding protein [Marmoricola sp.]|nr:AMP-binding protein [Marmoricola sp.]HNN47475.1 AMP-binding protein [Marmoricola sp.]